MVMMVMQLRPGLTTLTAMLVLASANWASAVDALGSADHPLVGRYAGSNIVYYKLAAFDEVALLKQAHNYSILLEANQLQDRSGAEWLKLEGAVTEIRYDVPPGRSSLEVIRNYEQTLKDGGFTPEFDCTDKDCFAGNLLDPYLLGQQLDPTNVVSTAYFDRVRYVLAKRNGPKGVVYASIIVGEDKGTVTAFVKVVETGPMETGKIELKTASAIEAELQASGSVDLYGIFFDTNDDAVKPDSRPALDEIGKLLTANPQMRLRIVGHTDDVGTSEYNRDLSIRRAANVVEALVSEYGIAADRLSSSGAGESSPVTSNATPEDQARNRRVEIVAQ